MATITLLGTSHIAKQSVRQIQSTVVDLQPTIVAVELDRKRLYALLHEQKTSLRLSDIRRIGLQGFLFAWIGGIVQRKLGASVGVLPGTDMLSAIKIAQQQGAQVALIDQDIEITLRRFSTKLSWRERGRFVLDLTRGLLFGKRELKRYGLGALDLRKVPSDEIVRKMMNIVRERYPNIYQVLVHERNVVMTHRLRHIATQHPEAKILAVVGAGHVEGMRELLAAEHRVVADGFIRRGNKVLLGKRGITERFLPGYWELIGGKVEAGETPAQALTREIREELGIDAAVGNQFHTFSYTADGRAYTLQAFLVDIPKGVVRSKVHDALRWVTSEEVGKLQLTPEMREAILKGFAATESI